MEKKKNKKRAEKGKLQIREKPKRKNGRRKVDTN